MPMTSSRAQSVLHRDSRKNLKLTKPASLRGRRVIRSVSVPCWLNIKKAPQVTRDRMYIDAMRQVYSNVTKVMVESRQGSNLLYLPLDKIMQMTGPGTGASGSTDSGGSVAYLNVARVAAVASVCQCD